MRCREGALLSALFERLILFGLLVGVELRFLLLVFDQRLPPEKQWIMDAITIKSENVNSSKTPVI